MTSTPSIQLIRRSSMSESNGGFSGIDASFSGFVLDPAKCSLLNLEEKRTLVHEIAWWSKDAPALLHSFSRRELLEMICVEMGKERKYTGLTKTQMVEHLLKLVSQNSKKSNGHKLLTSSPTKSQVGMKRQRTSETALNVLSDFNHDSLKTQKDQANLHLCQNVACKAHLNPGDVFCKRCSCCICHCYDDNKDPSLWLTCGAEDSDENGSCGMSCHLECALKHERAGILKSSACKKLDGSYYCISCGKANSLMRTWRKQLLIAKEARRVDVLCLRMSMAHRILVGTKSYTEMQKILKLAINTLNKEVGPLDQVCLKMGRGIVNRLSCGIEVQGLCTSAVEAFDSISCSPDQDCSERKEPPLTCQILFEESFPTSVMVVLNYDDRLVKDFTGGKVWHCTTNTDYPENPTFVILKPEKRFKINNLFPSTDYSCKVSLFSSSGVVGVWEAKWSTPTPLGRFDLATKKQRKTDSNTISRPVKPANKRLQCGEALSSTSSILVSPSTPCKTLYEVSGQREAKESNYEHSVRAIKWLEHEGHINEDFRVKFLTWFSLKASMQERRVVSAFVNALIDDPPSLAGQLIHTFMDEICSDQKSYSPQRLCTRLWH